MKPLVKTVFNTENIDKSVLKYIQNNPDEELWANELYLVNVRRNEKSGWFDENGQPILMTHLSIKNKDRSAKVDWRNFQYIKNQIVGEENEGCEIYPAESRLVDTANSFHIWVFENPENKFPFGFEKRLVSEKSFNGAIQRPFPYNRKPIDLRESEEELENLLEKYKK